MYTFWEAGGKWHPLLEKLYKFFLCFQLLEFHNVYFFLSLKNIEKLAEENREKMPENHRDQLKLSDVSIELIFSHQIVLLIDIKSFI